MTDESPREEIDRINQAAWELRHSQMERSLELCQQAFELASSGEFAGQPYQAGQAASLTTQGYLYRQMGKLDMALAKGFEAVVLMDQLPSSRTTVDAWRLVGWIYYFLGDLSNAFDFGLKALKLAQSLDLKTEQASVLDSLATMYVASNDFPQALQSQEEALQIARDAKNQTLENTVLNNSALALLEMGKYAAALDLALQSLQIAEQLGHTEQQISVMDTVGQVYLKMGDLPRAKAILEEALTLSVREENELAQVYCELSLGKITMKDQDMARSLDHFQTALDIAVKIGARAIQVECYQAISELYEKLGNLEQAFIHFRRFHTTNNEVHNAASEKRLAVLKVAHQVETARRDAEIYRLRNIELTREIEERIRMEAELERLATIDPLTGLNNRRHFFHLAGYELEKSKRYHRYMTVFMVDVDLFKRVNDRYGHITGDQVLASLAGFIKQNLRNVDILSRFGGEEFCAILPETGPDQGLAAAERIRKSIEERRFETPAGLIDVTISLGVACLPDDERALQITIDHLIDQADRALYKAKNLGRNRTEMSI